MDAKTFLSAKHTSAVDELKAIEAEYRSRIDAAKTKIAMTKTWLDELEAESPAKSATPALTVVEQKPERPKMVQDTQRESTTDRWSLPSARQAS